MDDTERAAWLEGLKEGDEVAFGGDLDDATAGYVNRFDGWHEGREPRKWARLRYSDGPDDTGLVLAARLKPATDAMRAAQQRRALEAHIETLVGHNDAVGECVGLDLSRYTTETLERVAELLEGEQAKG